LPRRSVVLAEGKTATCEPLSSSDFTLKPAMRNQALELRALLFTVLIRRNWRGFRFGSLHSEVTLCLRVVNGEMQGLADQRLTPLDWVVEWRFWRGNSAYSQPVTISLKSAMVEKLRRTPSMRPRCAPRSFSSASSTITLSKNVSTVGRSVAMSASASL
jgi:hypothetical protein